MGKNSKSSFLFYPSSFVCAVISFFILYPASSCFSNEILLVADFNDQSLKNKFNENIGAWGYDPNDPSQWCKISFDETTFVGPEGSSLRIDYNIASNKTSYVGSGGKTYFEEVGIHHAAFNGVYVILNKQDVSSYQYLVFSAKGDKKKGFTRKFKLELKDQDRMESIIFDRLTSRWQKFFIPLEQSFSKINLKEVREFVIVFDQNMTRSEGTIYLDDIYFAKDRKADLYGPIPAKNNDK